MESSTKSEEIAPKLTKRPEVIDDYIRNYLSSKGLHKSLDAFQVGIEFSTSTFLGPRWCLRLCLWAQNEWYEFQQTGKLSPEDVTIVPDVYQRNHELADALQKLRVDVENYKDIAR